MSIACLTLTMLACSKDDNKTTLPTITDIAVDNPDFSILVEALERTGLDVVLANNTKQFTVFAPTNAAFNTFFSSLGTDVNNVNVDVLKAVLLNHVLGAEVKAAQVPTAGYATTLSPFNAADTNSPGISMFLQKEGTNVFINGGTATTGVKVTTADVDASNGVIHIVNAVIAIPTIVDHAVANPNFSTLTSLLVAQDLAATLDGTAGSPFTVFAPLNTAFDTATLDLYTGLSSDDKTAVLLYHVVGGVNVRSNAIPTGNITTLQGQSFSITGTVIDDASSVNKNIVLTDVQCSNGIVHAIDKVLLPNL